MKSRFLKKIFSITLLLILFTGCLFTHFYAPRFITEIQNPLIGFLKPEYQDRKIPQFDSSIQNGKAISFKSEDGHLQSAYITFAKQDSAIATIILLHGIRAYKEHFIELSNKLSSRGFHVVALDLRAHGQSEGRHCTFGVKEKEDVGKLIDYLESEFNIIENIGIWGQSLGGAVAIQSLANDKRIKFGIVESTFSDFKTITNDYFNYHVGINIKPLTNYLVNRAGKIAGFDPKEARTSERCKEIIQPILMVHGTDDKRINLKYGRANFNNLKTTEKQFLEIEDGTHLNVWKKGGDEYFNHVIGFIVENN